MKEGTSAVLLQSGLDEKWSADSMECYCYLRKVQDFLRCGEHLEIWSFRLAPWLNIIVPLRKTS